MRTTLALISGLVLASAISFSQARLLKDINKTPLYNGGSWPGYYKWDKKAFVRLGKLYFFSATTTDDGRELWVTDGTEKGTRLVKDIKPGYRGSGPGEICVAGGKLFFSADDGIHGQELWISDGTSAGTIMVKDIFHGMLSSGPSHMVAYKGKLLFSAHGTDNSTPPKNLGAELWISDGTWSGTKMIKDIFPGNQSSSPKSLVQLNGKVYFAANDSKHGSELWVTDGSAKGTLLLKDISPGTANSRPAFLTPFGNKIIFCADNGKNGREPWISDGTAPGTVLLKDLDPKGSSEPNNFIAMGKKLFFVANFQHQLWVTDGTLQGTFIIKNMTHWAYQCLGTLGTRLFFCGYDKINGLELWTSDGTLKGTHFLKDLNPGQAPSFPRNFCRSGNNLFFSSTTDTAGMELWKTDGTAAGTNLVKDICPGKDPKGKPYSGNPAALAEIAGGKILFSAYDNIHNVELWISDGTNAGTRLVKDINCKPGGSMSSHPAYLTDAWGTLWFTADDAVHGRELWRSDGTEAGTRRVTDIGRGKMGSTPMHITFFRNKIIFSADEYDLNGKGRELYCVDLITGLVRLIKDINPGKSGSWPSELTVVGDKLFFSAHTPSIGVELWMTDGTAAGTKVVRDINPGWPGSNPRWLTPFKGKLFFTVKNQLWKSDGTFQGTLMVKDTYPGGCIPYPALFTVFQDRLYFSAIGKKQGTELWVSDGSHAGTKLFKEIRPGYPSSNPSCLAATPKALFFLADDGIHGRELWKSDGTPSGTIMVKDIHPGSTSCDIWCLNAWGDEILFYASDGSHGKEPWISDGTSKGTFMLKDIYPGSSSSQPVWFTPTGSRYAFFIAQEDYQSCHIWRTDGTKGGTMRICVVNPKPSMYYPTSLTFCKGSIYFCGNDGTHGYEVLCFDPGASAQPFGQGTSSASLTATEPVLGGTMKVEIKGLAKGKGAIAFVAAPNSPPFPILLGESYLYIKRFIYPIPATGIVKVPNNPALKGATLALQALTAPENTLLGIGFTNGVYVTCGY